MKRIPVAKIIGVITIVTAAIVIAGYAVFRLFVSPDKIRTMAASRIERTLGRKVYIKHVEIVFFPMPGISFDGITVSNTPRPGFSQEPFLYCECLSVYVSPLSLIKRRPLVHKIILKKPDILIEIDSTGSFNYDDLGTTDTRHRTRKTENKKRTMPLLPIPASLKVMAIENGRCTYHSHVADRKFVVADIKDRTLFSIDDNLRHVNIIGSLSIGRVSLQRSTGKEFTDLTIGLKHDLNVNFVEGAAEIKKLRLSFQKIFLDISGSIANLDSVPILDVELHSLFNAHDVKDMTVFPSGASLIEGNVKADISVKGEFDPGDPSKMSADGTIDLTDITVMLSPNGKRIVCNGNFILSSQSVNNTLSVTAGRSSLKMTAALTDYLSLVPADAGMRARRPSAGFNVTSEILDFDEFLSEFQTSNERKPRAPGNTVGKSFVGLPVILPGVDMRGEITAVSLLYNKIEVQNLSVQVSSVDDTAAINLSAKFAGGSIDDSLHLTYSHNAHVGFTNKLKLRNVEAENLLSSISRLTASTAVAPNKKSSQKSLKGRINAEGSISGNGNTLPGIVNSLKGDITASMEKGSISNSLIVNRLSSVVDKFIKINDISFNNLTTSLHIAKKMVHVKKLYLQSNTGDWSAVGTIHFDTRLAMNIRNRLTQPMSTQVIKVQNGGKSILKGLLKGNRFARTATTIIDNISIPTDKKGRVTLKLSLKGTTAEPVASFNGFGR